jgi:hypothetical protein
MANRECGPTLLAEPPAVADFRPHALRQSLGLVEQCLAEPPLVERRCTEQDLLQYFLQLESSRDQLQRATREAQLSAQAKTNEIIGMTAALLSRDLPGQEREYIKAIRHSAEALLAILEGGF